MGHHATEPAWRACALLLVTCVMAPGVAAQGGQSAPPPSPPPAAGEPAPAGAVPGPAPATEPAPVLHAAPFPGIEPFKETRFWEPATETIDGLGLTPAALEAMAREFGAIREAKAGADEAVEKFFGTKVPKGVLLGAGVPEARKVWSWQVPIVLRELAPLWRAAEWDDAQLQQALVAAGFFAQQPDAPKLAFVAGSHAGNHAQLDLLATWFRAEVAKPESYALMVITNDDGPWIPQEAKPAGAKESSARVLEGERRLVLAKKSGASTPWLLQLHEGKKVKWTRALTQVPPDSTLRFTGGPKKLGDYGWILPMSFGEVTFVYLDTAAQPLFYFTSWSRRGAGSLRRAARPPSLR